MRNGRPAAPAIFSTSASTPASRVSFLIIETIAMAPALIIAL
jgi:hypothetical protein